jgi:hypothetical protein
MITALVAVFNALEEFERRPTTATLSQLSVD